MGLEDLEEEDLFCVSCVAITDARYSPLFPFLDGSLSIFISFLSAASIIYLFTFQELSGFSENKISCEQQHIRRERERELNGANDGRCCCCCFVISFMGCLMMCTVFSLYVCLGLCVYTSMAGQSLPAKLL